MKSCNSSSFRFFLTRNLPHHTYIWMISFPISYVSKTPLRRTRHLRRLKWNKNKWHWRTKNIYLKRTFFTWGSVKYFYAKISSLFLITKWVYNRYKVYDHKMLFFTQLSNYGRWKKVSQCEIWKTCGETLSKQTFKFVSSW